MRKFLKAATLAALFVLSLQHNSNVDAHEEKQHGSRRVVAAVAK